MKSRNLRAVSAVIVLMAFCSGCIESNQQGSGRVPTSWYVLPERDLRPETDESSASAAFTLDKMLKSTERALEKAAAPSARVHALEESAPWRMSYFITDIAVTFQGLLALVVKGTPTVEMSWFPQYPARRNRLTALEAPPERQDPAAQSEIVVTGDSSADQLSRQINPVIRAALGTGFVQDGALLKKELIAQVTSFQKIAKALDRNPGVRWWPSRYRVDFNIDASGKLTPALEAGGGVRLRLAWYRMKRNNPPSQNTIRRSLTDTGANAGTDQGFAQTLGFLTALAEDIQAVSDQLDNLNGYKAYSVKVALATTLKGTVGIAKANGSIAGYIYFSRDVPKPVVNPPPAAKTLAMVERSPSEARMRFAMNNGIKFTREDSDAVVYDVDREEFKDGLRKAAQIASFFAEHAAQLKPETKESAWKIYELVIGYELSVSGDVGLVQLGESAITEISFYNQKF
jgi:hypothetical protein